MNAIETDAGHFLVAGLAFPDDPDNARAIRLFRSGVRPTLDRMPVGSADLIDAGPAYSYDSLPNSNPLQKGAPA